MPRGLVGRQVANAEMLSALLRYGRDEVITFLVHDESDIRQLKATLKSQLPAGKRAIISRMPNVETWMKQTEPSVLWEPQPPSANLAWTRSRLNFQAALGGITHSLCSAVAVSAIRDLVAAPVRRVDLLVCTSEAVAHTARTLIEHWSAVMGKTAGPEMITLETIPLGIDCDRHRPATVEERRQVREKLQISEESQVVLFVGRLSHHAKANPLPMFAACQRAAQRIGKPVVLLLAGWYANTAIKSSFEREASRVAPDVQLLTVNAMDAAWRDSIWAAADVFVSLADSVQETFGLTVVEAMSRRLPVVASDWNGYRDTIQHGHTGWLVPTAMVAGAGEQALLAMHEGRINYDKFLAAVGQTVCVSTSAACEAIEVLLTSPEKRFSLAEAGYRHVRERFAWPKIIARYEKMWSGQFDVLKSVAQKRSTGYNEQVKPTELKNRIVPPLQDMFARYPTTWLDAKTCLTRSTHLLGEPSEIANSPLANHSADWRVDLKHCDHLLAKVYEAQEAGMSIEHLLVTLDEKALNTIAWGLKFDLIQPKQE